MTDELRATPSHIGRKRAIPRKRPRNAKPAKPAEHVDKYADRSMDDRLAALAAHFNGGRR